MGKASVSFIVERRIAATVGTWWNPVAERLSLEHAQVVMREEQARRPAETFRIVKVTREVVE